MALLSHYTSENGLIGIVRSQSLWATEFAALNDESELIFALQAIYAEALARIIPDVPNELIDPSRGRPSVDSIVAAFVPAMKRHFAQSEGYDSPYICSFARGRSEDEDKRGILTLWMRYTGGEGFCIQFEEDHIQHILQMEAMRGSFGWLELAEVRYGIDRTGSEFLYLVEQMTQQLRLFLYKAYQDRRFEPDNSKLAPDTIFGRKLAVFCALHKDPAFSDEREMRIFAYPAEKAEARPFTGLAMPKRIYRRNNQASGARYIVIGEGVLPGVAPSRIVVGPKSKIEMEKIRALYPLMPPVASSNIPIR